MKALLQMAETGSREKVTVFKVVVGSFYANRQMRMAWPVNRGRHERTHMRVLRQLG